MLVLLDCLISFSLALSHLAAGLDRYGNPPCLFNLIHVALNGDHNDQTQEIPLELLRFLALILNRFEGKVSKACGLSPSAAMDQLWHHVLLNTSE